MKLKPPVILPLAAALAALSSVPADAAPTKAPVTEAVDPHPTVLERGPVPTDLLYEVGEDLFSMTVLQAADGTVYAEHGSHRSHSSHRSHRSHVSSR
jgi:hypothetical protein